MAAVEPNWTALILFGLVWGASCIAFLTLVGMVPLRLRPEAAQGGTGAILVIANLALLAALAIGAVAYARVEIRWTSAVIVGGLIVLFAPGLFQAWPSRLRDSRAGLALLTVLQASALALLAAAGRAALLTPPT